MRDDLGSLIDGAAYVIYKRYRAYTEAADLRQEMWAWVLAQPAERLEELDTRKLSYKLRDAGEVYARKDKAAKVGYLPTDEVFYGITTIRELLPIAVSDETVVLRKENEEGRVVKSGPPKVMEYETAVADLRKAYRRLSSKYRTVLAKYVAGVEVDEVQVNRALRFMQRKLGGRRPMRGDL